MAQREILMKNFSTIIFSFLSFCILLSCSIDCFAQEAATFPDQLPSDFLTTQGFIAYKDLAPIGEETLISKDNVDIFREKFNEKRVEFSYSPDRSMNFSRWRILYKENAWMKLEKGTQIQRVQSPDGEKWVFPLGTIFVHCIYFAEEKDRLMECRVEGLTAEGWKYRTYSPGYDHRFLYSTQYPDGQKLTYHFNPPQKSGRLLIKITALSPRDCVRCHALTHDHGQLAQPCGFGPQFIDLNSTWIKSYTQKFGQGPFANLK